jgi:DNA-binding CsgD family transcriptional regulator
MRAHVSEGTQKGAAHALGITRNTLTRHLQNARHRLDCDTTEQAVYLLARSRELRV